ncbi:MAG TPA: hypothetical protein VG605_08810 [Puia sp.]|jgi:hypothetical protein|nr:hypothetical protein [Puia sp.]
MIINKEPDFLRQLCEELASRHNYQLEKVPYAGDPDLLVKNPASGKAVAIELKDAGAYGELPISTILPISKLAKQTDKFAKVILITFSNVPALLSQKLAELNVEAITRPTVKQAAEKVQLALSA